MHILKVSLSISAKTGIAFQCNTAAEHAVIVHVGKIISSPGSIPIAPTAHVNPVDQEFTVMAYLTLKKFLMFVSNLFTYGPPFNPDTLLPKKPESTPDFNTLNTAFFSLSS